MTSDRNTFAERSDAYASARPRYPAALFRWLAEQCALREAAWDCATGNGQAAAGLASTFASVHATDVSAEQIAHAVHLHNIRYTVAPAEQSGLPPASFDLVAVAQALHWFDFASFWPEVARVARPGAFFCAWGYASLESTPEVDERLVRPFEAIVAPFWPAKNRILWDGYRDQDIGFPLQRVAAPRLAIEVEWTPAHLIDFLMTWSAYKLSRANAQAAAAMDSLVAAARSLVAPEGRLPVRMPLTIVAGRLA